MRIREATVRWVMEMTERYNEWTKRERRKGTQNTARVEKEGLLGNSPTGTTEASDHDNQPKSGGEKTEATTEQRNANGTADRGRQGRIARWWHRRKNPQNDTYP